MTSIIQNWIKNYRKKKTAKRKQTINLLTIQYQIFRGLLDSNDIAVDLLSELNLLAHSDTSLLNLRQKVLQLLDAVEEMVELLNQLDHSHNRLRHKYHSLQQAILEKVPELPQPDEIPPTVFLTNIPEHLIPLVGNKAASLSELAGETRYNIPGGFSIPSPICREFIEHNNLFAHIHQLLRGYNQEQEIPMTAIDQIKEMIQQASLPDSLADAVSARCELYFSRGKGLAVRSSSSQEDTAAHSFAGQYDTVLNVVDLPSALSAFRRVVASNYNARCLAYRQKAQLPLFEFDMAVLFLEMVPAASAGVMLTRSPSPGDSGMLISGTYGLGESVVSGSSATDLYYLDSQGHVDPSRTVIAKKESRVVCSSSGGILTEPVPANLQELPVLNEEQLTLLYQWGTELESLKQGPQDIEWAFDAEGKPVLLQARPLTRFHSDSKQSDSSGKMGRSETMRQRSGIATGRVHPINSTEDLTTLPDGPLLLVMRQSIPDAAGVLDRVAGLLIEKGNPTDHLTMVAREYQIPVLHGENNFPRDIQAGEWMTLDEGARSAQPAEEREIRRALQQHAIKKPQRSHAIHYRPGSLAELLFPLNLTDAYGPTFSIAECRSLHDVVRYTHEKGVLAMFEAGDYAIEKGGARIHILDIEAPFIVNIIDLGGGLLEPGSLGRRIQPAVVQSYPFLGLLEGICNENLQWGPSEEGIHTGSVMSRWITDQRSARPIGMPNYAIISRDYLNLNARMDFHFTMIDSVCGFNSDSNYIRFRFNGGGTNIRQRNRRAECIRLILEKHGFFTDIQNDLVNGIYEGSPSDVIHEKLSVLGRLLGFTRLLDAVMSRDELVQPVADAFVRGDYKLGELTGSSQDG